MSEQPTRRRRFLRPFTRFALEVLAGALAAILGAIFLNPVQKFIVWAAPENSYINQLVVQSNELADGAVRLNAREVSRFLGNGVAVEAESVGEWDGRPVARIKISVPNRDNVVRMLHKGQDAVFEFRNVKHSLKVVQVMPEDETVDVSVAPL